MDVFREVANRIKKVSEKLLKEEKERRNLKEEEILFLGVSNFAQFWWCGEKSYLKSLDDEKVTFECYLYDRVIYSLLLGKIKEIPEDEKLLDIGKDLKIEEVEELIRKTKVKFYPEDLEETILEGPLLTGKIMEKLHAEKYPTFRWFSQIGKYVIIGMPDGITSKFVYEFKTTSGDLKFIEKFVKPVAFTQADTYGEIFKRNWKKVQFYSLKDKKIYTYFDKVSKERILQTYEGFKRIEEGKLPIPPAPWKCRKCEYINRCRLKKS